MKFFAIIFLLVSTYSLLNFSSLVEAQLPDIVPDGPTVLISGACLAFDEDDIDKCEKYDDDPAKCVSKKQCFWRSEEPQNTLATFNNEQFWPARIEEIVNGTVYQAIGYGLANMYFVKTPNQTWFLIDATESNFTANLATQDFLSASGVNATDFWNNLEVLIYTHGHADHTWGAAYFVQGVSDVGGNLRILSHSSLLAGVDSRFSPVRTNIAAKTLRMTGWFLPKDDPDWHVSSGLGPYLGFFGPVQLIPPTETFTEPTNVTIGGLEIQLYHTPGETIEELFAYIDDISYDNIGFIGDNYYAMFPQLYTIRGTTPRPADDWANSLHFVLNNFPDMQIVAAGHTKVLQGRTQIEEALSDWILAIEDLSATTIAEINTGKSIYDIAANYQLPAEIQNSPYLGEFYGQIPDHVRAIHTQFNGWFTGDITELATESTYQKASFLLDLCNNCLKDAEDFLEEGRYNNALKLSDAIRVVMAEEDSGYCDDDDYLEATDIYIQAAKLVAYEQPASNNRNFFLTVALQISEDKCLLIKG